MELIIRKIHIVGTKMIPSDIRLKFDFLSNFSEGCLNFLYKGRYQGREVVLKIYNPEFYHAKERFQNELNVLKRLGHNFYIPKLVAYSEQQMWIMYEFVNGKSLKTKEKKKEPVDLQSLVDSILKTHSAEIIEGNYNTYIQRLIKDLEIKLSGTSLSLDSSIRSAITYLKRESKHFEKARLCRVHGDINGSNIILEEDGKLKVILDWEFSHFGDKYLDIAQFTNRGTDFDKEFLNRYFANEKFDKRRYEFFLIYFLLKICINNAPENLKKMASVKEDKLTIVKAKYERLKSMF